MSLFNFLSLNGLNARKIQSLKTTIKNKKGANEFKLLSKIEIGLQEVCLFFFHFWRYSLARL